MTVKLTTVSSSYMMDGKHLGPGPWLGVIHEINGRTQGNVFREPLIEGPNEFPDRECYTEIYPDFDVEFRGRGPQACLVTIVSKNEWAADLLRDAAEHMNLTIDEED